MPRQQGDSIQIGLQLSDIRECSLVRPKASTNTTAFRDFLKELEPFADVVPALVASDRQWIVEGLAALAESGDVASVYQWSDQLLAGTDSPQETGTLALLRARCLFAMGLREQASVEAAKLIAQYDPLCIPADLCQLMAALAQARGDYQSAAEWSALPGLRIPAEPLISFSPP